MIERKNDAFLYRFNDCNKDWSQVFLLMADVHWDSIFCDRKLFFKHLDEAKERDARILIYGDFFDAMGGKYDPRTSKADIRPEYSTQHYFDDIIMDAAAQLKPYKDLIDMISEGNHEINVKKRHEVDLLGEHRGLGMFLNCFKGRYSGFIKFQFAYNKSDGTYKVMYWTHGAGGNAMVTQGAINTNRRQESTIADWFVSAHIHTEFDMTRTRSRIDSHCNVRNEKIFHWQLASYYNPYLSGGWGDQKEHRVPALGGRWLELSGHTKNIKVKSYITD